MRDIGNSNQLVNPESPPAASVGPWLCLPAVSFHNCAVQEQKRVIRIQYPENISIKAVAKLHIHIFKLKTTGLIEIASSNAIFHVL